MADPFFLALPTARLGRRPRQLIAALLAILACLVLHRLWPGAATTWLLRFAMALAWLALLLRVHDNFKHGDRLVRASAWLGAAALIGSFIMIGRIGSADQRAVVHAVVQEFAATVIGAWLLIGIARRRWLAQAPRRGVTLSVSVICRDEVDRIGRCLEAVAGWADQIVVLDSGSTDGTVELARHYTDLVEVTDWPGYGPQKQRALERCSSEWVLSLDADEVISPELKREIDATLASAHGCSAFRNPWVSVLFGGPIDFGADGRYHTRLFRRDAAHFDGAAVHEEVVAQGRRGTLEAPVYHYTFRDLAHLERKFGEYARLSAESRYAKGKRATRIGALLRGGVSFLLLYLLRLGVLDGRRGLLMAAHYARYTYDKYAGLIEIERRGGGLS